jgi:predicted dehydrogenase
MLPVGIVGCGAVVETLYAAALLGREAYAVRFVCDLDPARAARAAAIFGAEPVPLDVLAARAGPVVVATPPASHAEIVRSCLREGRVVLCEKPFTPDAATARELVDAAAAAGTRLYVGHFRRRFPQVELARRLVRLGLIGEVTGVSASEGGRFRWEAVSGYTSSDPAGGVIWDMGSHTLDMALFAAGLDEEADLGVGELQVQRDRPEPSHDVAADVTLTRGGRPIAAHLHVSRREALPNIVRIAGTGGSLSFSAALDDRVRLRTPRGSEVLFAGRSHADLGECFDLQLRSVLLGDGAETFDARTVLGQTAILEAIARG